MQTFLAALSTEAMTVANLERPFSFGSGVPNRESRWQVDCDGTSFRCVNVAQYRIRAWEHVDGVAFIIYHTVNNIYYAFTYVLHHCQFNSTVFAPICGKL